MAAFVIASMEQNSNPSFKKNISAMFTMQLQNHGMPNHITVCHSYPLVTSAFKAWDVELRENPHAPSKAPVYSLDAVSAILELPLTTDQERLDAAISADRHSNARRIGECWNTLSNQVKRVAATKEHPRMFEMTLNKNKSNQTGDLSRGLENLTYTIPCRCCVVLKATNRLAELNKFKRDIKNSPFLPCVVPCPFKVFTEYLDHCPDPFGQERDMERATEFRLTGKTSKDPLKLYRALAPTGDRRLTLNPLGQGSFGRSAERLNARLPEEYQHETGATKTHGARAFVVTEAIRAGMSDAAICSVTKHKDSKSLQKYHRVNRATLNSTSLTIAEAQVKASTAESDDDYVSDVEDFGRPPAVSSSSGGGMTVNLEDFGRPPAVSSSPGGGMTVNFYR